MAALNWREVDTASLIVHDPIPDAPFHPARGVFRCALQYDTTAHSEIRVISGELNELITRLGVDNGTLLLYSLHTTLGVLVQEANEPNLCEDFIDFLTALVENDGASYKHRCALHPSGTCTEDRFNAPSHVRQMLTNQSLVMDIQAGRLTLGRWQDVAFFELDGPRQGRQLFVKITTD
jgi:secondary thiamine-phosphate synthase enzyme